MERASQLGSIAMTDASLEAELNELLPGSQPLGDLSVRRTGMYEYNVLSARNDDVTVHCVDLQDVTCTCGDDEHNREDREPCAHYAAAFLHSDDITLEDFALSDLSSMRAEAVESFRAMEQARDLMEDAHDVMSQATADVRSAEAASYEGASDAEVAEHEPDGQAAAEAADELREAYEEVGEEHGIDLDMQVQHHEGVVWVQTGKDTPDELQTDVGPNLDVHEWLLQEPDQVMWVHDGSQDWADNPHRLYNYKPGEWWTNAIEPGDVPQYIEETLGVMVG